MKCPYCNKEIDNNVGVCPNCKAAVEKPKASKSKSGEKEK